MKDTSNIIFINGEAFGADEIVDFKTFMKLGFSETYAHKKNSQFRRDVGGKKIYTFKMLQKWLE